MHEPQANLGADQKFSPGRSKTRKGSLGKNKSVTDSAKPLKKENEKSKTKTKAPQTKAEKTVHEIFGNQVKNDL